MIVYELFRDTVSRAPKAGEEEIPGVPNVGASAQIVARDVGERLVEVGGDTVQRHVWWLMPEQAITPGDTLAGARVREVAEAQDRFGNRLYWIAYTSA